MSKRRRDSGALRLYVVSDFHASDRAWRKMLNAIRLNAYEADAVLYAGDLTGKAAVPVMETPDGYEAELLGRHRVVGSEKELMRLESDIAALGYYALRTTPEQAQVLQHDPAALDAMFSEQMHSRLHSWLLLAADRLEGSGVPLYVIPGNDDPYHIDEVLQTSQYVQNVDGKVVDLPGGYQVAGLGQSSPTPWRTPREVSEDTFRQEVVSLVEEAKHPRKTIFLIHCPPHGSGLDTAPLLDENLRPVVSAGDLLRGPVGSSGVREAIMEYQPLLSLHGHIHESGGEVKLGETLCLNPGSEASFGVVRGYLVDLSSTGVEQVVRVEG